MSLINTQIKPFKATAYHAGKFINLTEENFKGTWSVVMFYPADFTFVCPTELEDLAAFQPEFEKMGVNVYGVSTDSHFAHKAWADTSDAIKKVNYPLIGDPTGALSRNRTVGVQLGRGKTLEEILRDAKFVAEGIKTSRAARALSERHVIEMPIATEMCRVLYEGESPRAGLQRLMTRTLKAEVA